MCPTHDKTTLGSAKDAIFAYCARGNENRLNGFYCCILKSSMSLLRGKRTSAHVYKRQKLQMQSPFADDLITSLPVTENSHILSDIPSAIDEQQCFVTTSCDHNIAAYGYPNLPISQLPELNMNLNADGFIVYGRKKPDESDSINDSCSSSRSNVERISENTMNEIYGPCESSSSNLKDEEVINYEMVERDKCISILRKHGVLRRFYYRKKRKRVNIFAHVVLPCKACSRKTEVLKMIMCDNCDGVYHLECCQLQEKELPIDEWLCMKCQMRRLNKLKRYGFRKSANIMDGRRSKNPSRIALMLRDTGPYISDARVGKGFQADVPEWSGPVKEDNDTIGEPLELDTSTRSTFHASERFKCCSRCSTSNGLQSKGISDAPNGSGALCGKWRRSSHDEVHTDSWECFCADLWDCFCNDCPVPQKVETEEVLRQAKRMQKMRASASAERMVEIKKSCNILGIKKDVRQVYARRRITSAVAE